MGSHASGLYITESYEVIAKQQMTCRMLQTKHCRSPQLMPRLQTAGPYTLTSSCMFESVRYPCRHSFPSRVPPVNSRPGTP